MKMRVQNGVKIAGLAGSKIAHNRRMIPFATQGFLINRAFSQVMFHVYGLTRNPSLIAAFLRR
jgi:hypothetical protein